ncbi:MAG: hypothetical protein EXX96DRAFT_375385 [Benjaminiella poitrasii]|nr:MAG: hypothetical protein EXX96DRAFT_375385 [Benjaminiella poitrasii]
MSKLMALSSSHFSSSIISLASPLEEIYSYDISFYEECDVINKNKSEPSTMPLNFDTFRLFSITDRPFEKESDVITMPSSSSKHMPVEYTSYYSTLVKQRFLAADVTGLNSSEILAPSAFGLANFAGFVNEPLLPFNTIFSLPSPTIANFYQAPIFYGKLGRLFDTNLDLLQERSGSTPARLFKLSETDYFL